MYYDPYLAHYGVKGMKWGVRRATRKDSKVRRAKEQMNRDADALARAARRTKTFAVTKRGKQKQAKREAEFNRAFAKSEKSTKAYETARKEARARAEKNLKNQPSTVSKVKSEIKRVASDYSRHPMLAMRDMAKLKMTVDVTGMLVGPYLRQGSRAVGRVANQKLQDFYDRHPTYEV